MSLLGFGVMAPTSTVALVDTSRWRPVIYADTPRSIGAYHKFLNEAKRGDNRKAILFLLGISNLQKVAKERGRFASILLFDDLQNLHNLREQLDGFEIVDIVSAKDTPGVMLPRHLTPGELADLLTKAGSLPESMPLLSKITNALGKRRPSVLETTSRMPMPEAVPHSGAQRLLSEVKARLTDESPPFSVVLDTYVKYLFRIIDRNKVTAVTKKIKEPAKEPWGAALDFASSDIGLTMARAFHRLCRTGDPDYRIGHAVTEFGLKPYSGDFVYFTAIMAPHRTCEFLPGFFTEDDKPALPVVKVFKPPAIAAPAKKSGLKKTKNRG